MSCHVILFLLSWDVMTQLCHHSQCIHSPNVRYWVTREHKNKWSKRKLISQLAQDIKEVNYLNEKHQQETIFLRFCSAFVIIQNLRSCVTQCNYQGWTRTQCQGDSGCQHIKMDAQIRTRWERCRTPMGTVPLSVIHGFDYPIYNNSGGKIFKDVKIIWKKCKREDI